MAKKEKGFPKSVYVYRGEEGGENEFLAVTTEIEEATELGEKNKKVAIYDLREVVVVSNRTTIN